MGKLSQQLKAIVETHKAHENLKATGVSVGDIDALRLELEVVYNNLRERVESLPVVNEANVNLKRCDNVILDASEEYWIPVSTSEENHQDGLIWTIKHDDFSESGTSRMGHWAMLIEGDVVNLPIDFNELISKMK